MSPAIGARKSGLIIAVVVPALIAGGCAHEQNYSDQPGWYAGGPRDVAVAPHPPAPVTVEMEDDGREAQVPPSVDARAIPDDPREPWSPNYGGPSAPMPRSNDPVPAARAALRDDAGPPVMANRVSWTKSE